MMKAMSIGFEQQWRRFMLIIKKWQKKKEVVHERGEPPLKRRAHQPVIDIEIKRMIQEFFRQSFNEN
jgi:hypothetical protein